MASLAVDQHQSVIRCQAAQVGGANQRCCVTDRLIVDVIGGNDISEQVAHVGVALIAHSLTADHVDRSG